MNGHYSVITNFGCHWTCPYCIVRETGFYRALRDAWLRGYMTTIEAWAEFYVFVAHFHRHYLL